MLPMIANFMRINPTPLLPIEVIMFFCLIIQGLYHTVYILLISIRLSALYITMCWLLIVVNLSNFGWICPGHDQYVSIPAACCGWDAGSVAATGNFYSTRYAPINVACIATRDRGVWEWWNSEGTAMTSKGQQTMENLEGVFQFRFISVCR